MARKNLSLTARLAAASTRQTAALATFETAASALEAASTEHSEVALAALDEADRLTAIAVTAQASAEHTARVALKVRDLTA